jgi:hypothetical protein
MSKDNFIKANKCVIGETYYLSGMWYELATSTPLINTPVKFIGKGTNSNVGKFWASHRGKHHFEMLEDAGEIIKAGEIVKAYAKSEFLLEPIDNPEILSNG